MRDVHCVDFVTRRGAQQLAGGEKYQEIYCSRSGFAGEIDPKAVVDRVANNSIRIDATCAAHLKVK
jgi:hypothetical protein